MSTVQSLAFISERPVNLAEFDEFLADRGRDDAYKYELLEGRIVMTPPSNWPEGEGEADFCSFLRDHVKSRDLGRVFGPNQLYHFPTGDDLAPDASFISHVRWQAGPKAEIGKPLRIVPELVVEITTPDSESRDRTRKRAVYAASGVREYWVVDLRRREITQFHVEAEGRFDAGRTLGESDAIVSRVLPDLRIPVRDLLVAL